MRKLILLTVIASALALVFAACEPIENGEFEEQPMEQPGGDDGF